MAVTFDDSCPTVAAKEVQVEAGSSGFVLSVVLSRDFIEELTKRIEILREKFFEVDPVAELRIAGDDTRGDQQSISGFEPQFEVGSRGKWIHALDVTSVEAKV